jgi:hypothetical protein
MAPDNKCQTNFVFRFSTAVIPRSIADGTPLAASARPNPVLLGHSASRHRSTSEMASAPSIPTTTARGMLTESHRASSLAAPTSPARLTCRRLGCLCSVLLTLAHNLKEARGCKWDGGVQRGVILSLVLWRFSNCTGFAIYRV